MFLCSLILLIDWDTMQIKYENSSLFIESTDKELDKELGVEPQKGVRTNLLACMPQINNDLMGDFSGRGLLAADKCIAFEKSLSLSEEQKIVVVREKYMTGFNMDMFFPVFASVNLFYLKCIENFSLPFLEGGESNRDLNCHESCEWDEVSNHLDVGARLHTAENSSLFRSFVAPELIDLSIDFNKKDVFSDCLRMGGFRVADYVTFDIAKEDLDCLFACKHYKFFALFENYLDLQGIYDRDKTYFLKINISFAGIGVVRLNPLNVHDLKALLTRYMGFRDAGLHVTLILSESLIVRPAPARSFLSYNDPYQSPNVTFAIADNGIFFNQASEQIIGNFTSYKGSTWSADLEKKFLDVSGEEVHRLAECLYTQGYRGYFGTDYVLGSSSSKQESYCLIGDGNFRING